MKEKILLVDDEPNVLAGYRRGLRQHFNVITAEGGERGLQAIENDGPFAVIVADMRMPGMDGVQFLKKVKRIAPDSVRMMLTGNADQETAMNAVNMGNIFRFLTKPCPPNTLVAALAVGVRQYRLMSAEKELLEQTLAGSVKILTEILSLTEPEMIAKAERLRDYVRDIAEALGIDNQWELEIAAMLSPLGLLTQPPELKTKIASEEPLTATEMEAVSGIPAVSGRLISNIPRLENVAEIIEHATGRVIHASPPEKPLDQQSSEIKIMRILSDLVEGESRGIDMIEVLKKMEQNAAIYETELVEKISQILQKGSISKSMTPVETIEVRIRNLLIGDVLCQNVESLDGRLLLSKGTTLTNVYLARLNNYRKLIGIQEPLLVQRAHTASN